MEAYERSAVVVILTNEWDDKDGDESGGDDNPIKSEDIANAVVTDTDWTSETILSQLKRGNIQLNPRFQRRDAWDKTRKSRFIESLVLGLPIPQIVLAEDKERRGKFIVLDGKQRLLTLSQFAAGSTFGTQGLNEGFEQLSLAGLEVRKDLRRFTLDKLDSDPARIDDLNSFLNQTIRTVVVRSWPNDEFLNVVFLRLNTGSVKLSPQELRQALHPGPFTNYLDDKSADSVSLKRALNLTKPDFRMRDVEVLLRFYGFYFRLNSYTGNLARFLDDTVKDLNSRWEKSADSIEIAGKECDAAIDVTFDIFGDDAFTRWSGEKYEGRFNRAVFDIMIYYFISADIRDRARDNRLEVKRRFEELCETDHRFVESIQTTTKTPEATHRRLERWGNVLSTVLDTEFRIPELVDNRIVK
ncbi:hypothetical protein ABIA39_000506 [Nocardia sp. GAS34]|uniref:DUF262 domain-containing protein n=1 Tax=unclassified Nocardia TaxID=2637762 RepID=UPI003D1F40FF